MGKIRQRWDEREKERKIFLGHKKKKFFLINQKMTFTFLSFSQQREQTEPPRSISFIFQKG
jgi:hypothetical protein